MNRFIIIFLLLPAFWSNAQAPEKDHIVVGIYEEPPFVIKDRDGSYYGLSIDLWYHLSDEMKITYELKSYHDQLGVLRALDYNEVDIGINPYILSGAKLTLFDAAQPFFISGTGIATSGSQVSQFQAFISNILSANFLRLVLVLVVMILIFGLTIWFIEKRSNPYQFKGLIDGFWWSVVTMTTVGYGDKAPKSFIGRTISVAWMFIAIVLISSFTATIASTMTVNTLESKLKRFRDVQNLGLVGAVDFSASKEYLTREGIRIDRNYTRPTEALGQLVNGQIDVMVYDRATLRHLVREMELENVVKILPMTVEQQYKSFLISRDADLLDQLNPRLVDYINTEAWKKTLKKYHLQEGD